MPKNRKYGILSELQFKVLKLRIKRGLSQAEIARILRTSRENVTIIEKRARRNVKLAEDTLQAYRSIFAVTKVRIKAGTHLVDIPSILMRVADKSGIKLRANFTRIYDEVRFKAGNHVKGNIITKSISILIFRNGDIMVASKI